jgi:hypothetical protein
MRAIRTVRERDEQLFQRGLGHAVFLNAEGGFELLELVKDHGQGHAARVVQQSELQQTTVLFQKLRARKPLLQIPRHALRGVFPGQLQVQVVADAVLRLQVLQTAQAHQLPTQHDAHPAAQRLALLHQVRGQDHRTVAAGRGDHVPHPPAGDGVHTGAGLVEEKTPRVPDQGDGQRQFALVPSTVRTTRTVGVFFLSDTHQRERKNEGWG